MKFFHKKFFSLLEQDGISQSQNCLVHWAVKTQSPEGQSQEGNKTKKREISSCSFCVQLSALSSSKNQEAVAIKCYSHYWSHWILPVKTCLGTYLFQVPVKLVRTVSTDDSQSKWTGALFTQTSPLCLTNSLISEGCEKQRSKLWHICRWSKQKVKWALLSTFPTLYQIFIKFV